MTALDTQSGIDNVEDVIDRFSGIRPMARKMGIPVTTVQGWKKRNLIPEDRVQDIIDTAEKHKISLQGISFINMTDKDTPPVQQVNDETATTVDTDSLVRPQITETEKDYSHQQPIILDAEMIKHQAVARSITWTFCILGVLGITGWFLFGKEVKQVSTLTLDQKQIETRVNGLSSRFASLEHTVTESLNDFGARITDIGAAVGIERDQNGEIVLNKNISLSERMAALENRLRAAGEDIDLGQMMNRLETLSQSIGGRGELNAAMDDLKTVIGSIQGHMDELDIALERAKQDNNALARSLEHVNGRDLSAAAMLLALTQFRSSMNREQPFGDDLETLRNLVGEDDPALTAAINRLAPHAESGVLSPAGLKEELKTITGDIVVAKLQGKDVSFKDRIIARIGQILSVEKDGKPVIAIKEQEIIAEAQDYLDKGDVAGAMHALNKLEGEAAQAAHPFQQKAARTLAAQNAEAMLLQNFLDRLTHPRPSTKTGLMGMTGQKRPIGLQGLTNTVPQMMPEQKIFNKNHHGNGLIISE